jgi:hypothetical protein
MKVRIKIGKGVTGAVRYVMGPGHDPETGRFRAKPDDGSSRVAWVSGTDAFGWKVESAADIDQARREMEFDALNQRSKTKKCEQDCVHIVLAWERSETPTREEMEAACRSQLEAQGMGNAKAIFVGHNDEDYFHAHIVASKINPATGRAYDLAGSFRKASVWAEQYEREHGGVVNVNRESANELRRAIRERDIEGVLEDDEAQRHDHGEAGRARGSERNPSRDRRIGRQKAQRRIRARTICQRDPVASERPPAGREAGIAATVDERRRRA